MLYFKWIGTAAVLLGLGVLFGAFGAHALEKHLDDHRMEIFNKGLYYHFIHGFAIFLVAVLAPLNVLSEAHSHRICVIFMFGLAVFCGSLYMLALSNSRWYGAVTPIGGIAFLLGWGMLAREIFMNL